MIKEMLDEIKRTEEKYDALVKESEVKAKEMIENAKVEAQKKYDEANEIIKFTNMKTKQKSVELGNEIYASIMKETNAKVEEIIKIADTKSNDLVEDIVGRVIDKYA